MKDQFKPIFGGILLLLSQMMVGVNIVSAKFLLTKLPIFLLLELRFVIATVMSMLIYHGFASKQTKQVPLTELSKSDWLLIVAQGLCAGFFFNVLMMMGLKHTSASIAGVITSALPAMIAIMSLIFLRERLTKAQWYCIAFATIGLLVINLSKFSTGSAHNSLLGDLIIVLALIPEAGFYILTKFRKEKLPVLKIGAWVNLVNAVVLLPFVLVNSGSAAFLHLTTQDWFIVIILGSSTSLFFLLWNKGNKHVSNSTAALFTAAMPIWTLIIAWLTLGEGLTPLQFIGMMLVLIAIIFNAKRKTRA